MGCIRVDKITEYLCDPLHRCLKVCGVAVAAGQATVLALRLRALHTLWLEMWPAGAAPGRADGQAAEGFPGV